MKKNLRKTRSTAALVLALATLAVAFQNCGSDYKVRELSQEEALGLEDSVARPMDVFYLAMSFTHGDPNYVYEVGKTYTFSAGLYNPGCQDTGPFEGHDYEVHVSIQLANGSHVNPKSLGIVRFRNRCDRATLPFAYTIPQGAVRIIGAAYLAPAAPDFRKYADGHLDLDHVIPPSQSSTPSPGGCPFQIASSPPTAGCPKDNQKCQGYNTQNRCEKAYRNESSCVRKPRFGGCYFPR